MPDLVRSLALALLCTASAMAQTSPSAVRVISYQGVLADGGAPVTASTTVLFRLHDAETGGAVVWADNNTVTPDADGRFSTYLGSVNVLPVFDRPLWLSASIGGTVLGPRTLMGAAPVALALYGVTVTPPVQPGAAPSIAAGHPENVATGQASVVAGGGAPDFFNQASGIASVVSGGFDNYATRRGAVVGGGIGNEAQDEYAVISGGTQNRASGIYSTIGGGRLNQATASDAVVSGGHSNVASGLHGMVPGGVRNQARGFASLAAGYQARAAHSGAFVWADRSTGTDSLVSTGVHQFLVRAVGGVGIGTDAPAAQLHVEAGTFGDIIGAYDGTDLRFRVQSTGDVTADGTFTGGGADLAEFFPLADGAQASPGQVVGLTGGRVSLRTDGAEQVAVISSDPAFIGNPDAADGGALVALVGQVEVQVSGDAAEGDLLLASGAADGRARAVSPMAYSPADGAVIGRVLTADGGRVVALVGVDEAAALRGVVARQQAELDALRDEVRAIRALLETRVTEPTAELRRED